MKNKLRILGIRGLPAAHGGFETFAEKLSLYLVGNGWDVTVYCQIDAKGKIWCDEWCGVKRVNIPVSLPGALGTIWFDFLSIIHALKYKDLCLTLGYNTAIFSLLLRVFRVVNLINMDGIEWSRAKWGRLAKIWFWLNDWAGCYLGNHLIADHPSIKSHLMTRVSEKKITMIPYGGDAIASASLSPLVEFGLLSKRFLTVIARPEPENSLLEIVSGFSKKPRGIYLVVLGNLNPNNHYHREVMAAASPEVRFVGAIYDKDIVQSLRFHCYAYIHGHQVGGTNPSLVEALGAGNPVIAHDNVFNRWVAGDAALYFKGSDGFDNCLDIILGDLDKLQYLHLKSEMRFMEAFRWGFVLEQYENLFKKYISKQ